MPTFDGYDADYVDAIEDGSYGSGPILKGGGDTLVTVPKGGFYEVIPGGAITGPPGPTGATGTATAADVDTVAGYVEWSSWGNLPITSDWERWSTTFAPPRYRYNQYSVQLSGLMRYLGPTITSGVAIIVTSLPSAIIPAYNQAASVEAGGSYQCDFRVYKTTSPPRMNVVMFPDAAPLETGSWISLDGVVYALD